MKGRFIKLFKTQQDPNAITEGVIWKQLLIFFFPILFGTFFQQLYNTVDAIIVGRYLGKESLAAVGGGTGFIINLLVGFFMGLSSGATVITSQYFGAKKHKEVSLSVHTAFALSIVGGLVITILGYFSTPALLKLLKTPADIFDLSEKYIKIYFLGIIPSIVYNMGAGILRAIGDSRRPFYYLIVGTFVNIILDFVFIAVFKMGVEGAAFATIIAQFVTMILVMSNLSRSEESYKLSIKKIGFTGSILSKILKIGFPTGLESVMYTISNLIIQANINSFGTDTAAAWAAFGKVDALFWMSISSFGIAITTFAGQNFGAKKISRIKQSAKQGFLITTTFTIILVIGVCVFANFLFSLFTDDQQVILIGAEVLLFIAPTYITFIPIEIFSGIIRGCGKTLIPTILTGGGVCLFRIVWLTTVVQKFHTIQMVCASYPISWIITSILFMFYYFYSSKRNFE